MKINRYLRELNLSGDDRWFLDDSLFTGDKRIPVWKQERNELGFDDRETWDLRDAFYLWLYQRLRKYMDSAENIVDLTYHKYAYKEEVYTQKDLIGAMLDRIRFRFSGSFDAYDPSHVEKIGEIAEIWALVLCDMWW